MTDHINVTPLEALRRLMDACKLIDYADCKDETVWQALGAAQGVAEGVVRDYVDPEPVGWLVFAEDHNGMTPQFPAYEVKLQATRYAAMFGQTATEVRPVYAAPVAAQPSEAPQPAPELREVLRDSLASGLTSTYYCNRVWSAWNVGSMSEEDFIEVTALDEIMNELCDLVIAVLSPDTAKHSKVIVPDGWKLVPITPTPKMVDATFNDQLEGMSHNKRNRHIYAAMLSATPTAAVSAAPSGEVEQPRFYMDHGLWHDRVTGQHMWTQDQYDEQYRDGLAVGRENAELAVLQPNNERDAELRKEGFNMAMDVICGYLPNSYYMDPPDGGSVSIPDQVGRMAADATRMRWMAEHGAYISYSMDGDVCSVWLPAKRGGDEDDRPAEGWPKKCYDSWQLAIDHAITATKE